MVELPLVVFCTSQRPAPYYIGLKVVFRYFPIKCPQRTRDLFMGQKKPAL